MKDSQRNALYIPYKLNWTLGCVTASQISWLFQQAVFFDDTELVYESVVRKAANGNNHRNAGIYEQWRMAKKKSRYDQLSNSLQPVSAL